MTTPVTTLAPYLTRWRLTLDGEPQVTPSSTIAFVRRADGAPALLKIARPNSDEHQSPAALRHWNGEGAVRLYEWDGPASLMERAVPGVTLADLVAEARDDDATAILAATMKKLRRPEPPPGAWPTLADWAKGIERQKARPLHPSLPHALLDRALTEFRDLIATAPSAAFIHGDLHHYNVLLDEHRGYLAIDPKGLIGDPAFEVATALRNPHMGQHAFVAEPKTVAHRATLYAGTLGYDRTRILRWAWCLMILSACWNIEDGDGPFSIEWSVGMARVIDGLV